MRIGVFIKLHKYKTFDQVTDPREVDPKEGKIITELIPCLDPDIPEIDKIDFEVMSQRFVQTSNLVNYESDECTPNFLAENNPDFVNYMPSYEVADKLLRKMLSVKEPEKELWAGFEVTKDIFTGGYKYARWVGNKNTEESLVTNPEDNKEEL